MCDEEYDNIMNSGEVDIEALWQQYINAYKHVVDCGEISSKNIVGDRGEKLAVATYVNTPSLTWLALALPMTVDALLLRATTS